MKKIIGIILVLAGLAIGFFGIPSLIDDNPDEILDNLRNGNEEAVTDRLSTIAEESVLEYDYSNAVTLKDTEKIFKKIKIPFSSKHIVMTYDGKMKIGADVSELEVKVSKSSDGNVQEIEILMPEMIITSNEIDRGSIDFPVEKGTIINKLENSDYDELETKAKKEIEKNVKHSNVMEDAEKELRNSLTGFLQGLYGEEIEVTFK